MESLVSFSSIKDDVKILNSKFDDLNDRLKVLQTDQVTTKQEVTELQQCLTENTGQITELANKLVALEVSTASKAAAVSEEINCLKNRMTTYPRSSEMQTTMQVSSELIVSGIPESAVSNLTPSQISSSIFDVLKVPELKADILCIRKVDVKSESSISINSNVRNRPPLHTFILKMKSLQVRDYIIDAKRKYKILLVKNVFIDIVSNSFKGNIYVNEFLHPDAYKLLRASKSKAKSVKFKYVWVQSSSILVRKDDDSPKIRINSEYDLTKLD